MKEKIRKILPKRMLALTLVLTMAVMLLPGMSMTVKATEQSVTIETVDEECEKTTFTDENSIITITGSYYPDEYGLYVRTRNLFGTTTLMTIDITADTGYIIKKVEAKVGYSDNEGSATVLSTTNGTLDKTDEAVGETITISDINASSITLSNPGTSNFAFNHFIVYYESSSPGGSTHTHGSWDYSASGATLIAECKADGECDLNDGTGAHKVSLTLTASSANYSGSAVSASFGKGEVDAWKEATGEEAPTVVYEAKTGSELTDGKAVKVGKYTAKITVGDVSASFDFEITKQEGPAAPTGLTVVSPSTEGGNDGKITGVTSDMEYSVDNGSNWKDVEGTEITGLSAGDVIVRVKETDKVKAGTSVTLTVTDGTVKVDEDKQDGNFEAGGIKNTVEEVKAAVLTTEDKEAIEAGKDVVVWVEVKDHTETVTKEDKTKVEEKLDKDFAVGTYLDVTLWKQITGSDANKVTDVPNGKVKIGFTIPKDLQKAKRTYKIVRVHDGVAEIIDAVVDAEFGLTFETDRFSTYALIYTDADVTKPAETPAKTPATGDTSPIALYVLMMGLAGVAMLVSKKRKAVR